MTYATADTKTVRRLDWQMGPDFFWIEFFSVADLQVHSYLWINFFNEGLILEIFGISTFVGRCHKVTVAVLGHSGRSYVTVTVIRSQWL